MQKDAPSLFVLFDSVYERSRGGIISVIVMPITVFLLHKQIFADINSEKGKNPISYQILFGNMVIE